MVEFGECRTASLDGVSLAYREQGSGEPLVLIHGSLSDLRVWDQQLSAFAAEFRTIAYSRRYARPNPDIEPGLDDQMMPHVDDLIRLIEVIEARPAHLLGHSWGGFIALLAAIKAPQAVRSLVLMEPPVIPLFVSATPGPVELFSLLIRRPVTAAAVIKFGAAVLGPARKAFSQGDDVAGVRAFGLGILGKRHFEAMGPAQKQVVWENRGSARAQILGAGFPPLREHDVRHVMAPTLLVVGKESPRIMHKLSERLLQLLPNAACVQIDDASHQMQVDNPASFNAAVLRFLNDQRRVR